MDFAKGRDLKTRLRLIAGEARLRLAAVEICREGDQPELLA
jgi:hypothetical protein